MSAHTMAPDHATPTGPPDRLQAATIFARDIVAIVKEAGSIGLAIIVMSFYMAQHVGWLSNVDRDDHVKIIEELQRQSAILLQNQKLMMEGVSQTRENQTEIARLARGICISVTKTTDIERRCLGETIGR